jgi:hypothetical protein
MSLPQLVQHPKCPPTRNSLRPINSCSIAARLFLAPSFFNFLVSVLLTGLFGLFSFFDVHIHILEVADPETASLISFSVAVSAP